MSKGEVGVRSQAGVETMSVIDSETVMVSARRGGAMMMSVALALIC